MSENRTIHLIDIPIGGKGGYFWNRLHSQREDICEALLRDGAAESAELLQARLRKVDDALDRLMSGSYGNCSNCGEAIDDITLEMEPTLEVCLDCWKLESGPALSPSGKVTPQSLNAFTSIMLNA